MRPQMPPSDQKLATKSPSHLRLEKQENYEHKQNALLDGEILELMRRIHDLEGDRDYWKERALKGEVRHNDMVKDLKAGKKIPEVLKENVKKYGNCVEMREEEKYWKREDGKGDLGKGGNDNKKQTGKNHRK
ncbi:hypothetical protein GLAREA_06978 [Glarea lozoyensis ATCC 20868]|uniref:Uncharacterized protein n=1 Tax=Glarea lozoyensis (strain ATCC 20868 / MF5171) TaxID=1116229 RepID=S3D879_GLAL2|nr:uncharacterized protein GLAREA_06978 [Glarea lozoyensis ATCC 20868]EPE33965.1 hypothetical protein GLAREA_06978 [Glarea lozoyensis ATCC 20868]